MSTSRSFLPIVLFIIIVLTLSPSALKSVEAARGGAFLSSVPSTQMPLFPESRDLTTMKLPPFFRERTRAFGGREVKGCMPKGLGHSSAPSRFVNYQPLGSAASRCSSSLSPPAYPPSIKP
ncbi:hypothetical protein CDL15_Pgr025103 [Punica granatum]|uniref:Transmembrane protein n=1 Tax=Punica granatum TaxID=22663 RepID=A0A218W8E9_PUNGR|nr:hypothetical protein CDL15_Pgr025103 [Punica granatum]PKI51945.1 hypothetical protein CRG98_027597 [Punica granatum]